MPPPNVSMAAARAGDVEAVGVVVDGGIAVGGGGVGHHVRAGGDHDAVEFDVLDSLADGAENDRAMAHELLDGLRRELGMLGQQRPLVGVVAELLHGGGHLIAGGVGACDQQAFGEHAELVGGESIAVVFGADQLGDQVVGQVVASPGDHLVDVGVECVQAAMMTGARWRRSR